MKTATYLTLALFVVGAIAAPALADPDHDRRDAAKERADERRADKMADREERHNATLDRAKERCEKYENRTGRDVPACDRLDEVHDHAHQARRAAHALLKAIDALEHRIVTLERLEVKFMEKLEQENLTANQTAAFEAKIERIQEAQNKTLEKIEKMEERLEKLKAKWDKVRDHVKDRMKIVVCHVDEDNETHTIRIGRAAWPAHEAHNDTRGPCEGDEIEDDELEAEDEEDEAKDEEPEGNSTADP